MWMSLLSNKFVWIGIAVAAVIAYYNIKIFGMEVSYNSKVTEFNVLFEEHVRVEGLYKTKVLELKDAINVNNSNIRIINQMEARFKFLNDLNSDNIVTKNKEIASLLKTIKRLRKLPVPVYVGKGIKVKDCRVFITKLKDNNESINLKTIGY